mmetsp:Transcript_30224/g.97218  ORF Transcript_30224/g.97218 Transcript_30224/m.97218 type:complete len:568 (-) Transcript_30224:435-2138(-)
MPRTSPLAAIIATSAIAILILAAVVLHSTPRSALEAKRHEPTLQAEINKLKRKLDNAFSKVEHQHPLKSNVAQKSKETSLSSPAVQTATKMALDSKRAPVHEAPAVRSSVNPLAKGPSSVGQPAVESRGRKLNRPPVHVLAATAADPISVPIKPETAVARQNAAWHRQHQVLDWTAQDQQSYDRAVSHARIAERGSHVEYEPLRLQKGYLHEIENGQEQFETQLVDLVKMLEPSYLSEALQWAESLDTRDNTMLEPIVGALERPIIQDLDMEARARVERAVEAIASKHALTLPEKEQLRAHLMAPLLMRIRARVHAQVSKYVTRMARSIVMKTTGTNMTTENYLAAIANHREKLAVPTLPENDVRFVNSIHDLQMVYKNGVIDKKEYETQKAKLLSDWLKFAVIKAGGNANEVLRLVFGGDVRGITYYGKNKKKSSVDVYKKVQMENAIASMKADRQLRISDDLVWQLVHGKAQWGAVTGCEGKWETSACKRKWDSIKDLIKKDLDKLPEGAWGETREGDEDQKFSNEGANALYKRLGNDARESIWEDQRNSLPWETSQLASAREHK